MFKKEINRFSVLKKKENDLVIELIYCGLCPDHESFKSRLELYQHFHSLHNINQEFRGYGVFTPKDIDDDTNTKIQENHTTLSAPKRIQLKDQEMTENSIKHWSDIQKTPTVLPADLSSVLPLYNTIEHTNIMYEKPDEITKQAVVNVDVPSSWETNIPSTDELISESQLRLANNLVTGTTCQTIEDGGSIVEPIEPKGNLNYYPTSVNSNGRGMIQPTQHSSWHNPYNVHPLSDGKFNGQQPWKPSTYSNIDMYWADKENLATNHQVRGFPDWDRHQVHDFASYQWHIADTHNDSMTNTRVNDYSHVYPLRASHNGLYCPW